MKQIKEAAADGKFNLRVPSELLPKHICGHLEELGFVLVVHNAGMLDPFVDIEWFSN
uniref:Uncharacterized protein n=1 Tax=viral metagenome TaxID=1070528 RepID=A0A6C0BP66_9ZZZZ